MGVLIDLVYLLVALISSPIWLVRMIRTGKIRTDWPGRFGRARPMPAPERPRVLLHGVSVGEVNAIRKLVDVLTEPPIGAQIVVSATTNTGSDRARRLFAAQHDVVRYPLGSGNWPKSQ